jgi:hypothetical protein
MEKEKETLTFRPSKKNKNLLSDLNKLAEQDNRTLNNYIENVLAIWLENNPINELSVRGQKNKKTAKRNVKSKD